MNDTYTITKQQSIFYEEKNKVLRDIQAEKSNILTSLRDDLLASDEREYLRRELVRLSERFQSIAVLSPYDDTRSFSERLAAI